MGLLRLLRRSARWRSGALPRRRAPARWSEQSAGIGAVQALALALGFLFVSLYGGVLGDLESLLFGNLLGVYRRAGADAGGGRRRGARGARGARAPAAVRLGRRRMSRRRAACPCGCSRSRSCCCSGCCGGHEPDHRRRCSCSRCSSLPAASAQALTRAAAAQPAADGRRSGCWWCGSGSASPTSRSTRRASSSRRSPSRSTCSRAPWRLRCGARTGARSSRDRPAPQPARGDRLMFSQEFMRNALLAGTFVALACGVSGWFVVLRGQVFAGDALSHVAFPGALAAAAAGHRRAHRPVRRDGRGRRRDRARSAAARSRAAQARAARCRPTTRRSASRSRSSSGSACSSCARLSASSGGGGGLAAARTLFGSIFGLSAGEARLAAVVALAATAARRSRSRGRCCSPRSRPRSPPRAACRRGCSASASWRCSASSPPRPRRRSARCCCSACSRRRPPRRTGSCARRSRASRSRRRSRWLAMWGGLALAYAIPSLPPSTAIVALAVSAYLLAGLRA